MECICICQKHAFFSTVCESPIEVKGKFCFDGIGARTERLTSVGQLGARRNQVAHLDRLRRRDRGVMGRSRSGTERHASLFRRSPKHPRTTTLWDASLAPSFGSGRFPQMLRPPPHPRIKRCSAKQRNETTSFSRSFRSTQTK